MRAVYIQGYKVWPKEMAELKDDQEDSSQEVLNIDQVAEKRYQKAEAMLHTRILADAIPGEEPSHFIWRIPPVVCPAASTLHLIRREGDMLKTAVETLLDPKKLVSVSREWTLEGKESSSF